MGKNYLRVHTNNIGTGIKIETGKMYTARNGARCEVISYNPDKLYPFWGRVELGKPGDWESVSWQANGRYASDTELSGWDIVKDA